MVRTTKTTTPATTTPAAAAPAVPKTASKASKAVAPIEVAPVSEAASTPIEEATASIEAVSTVFEQFSDFMTKLQAVSAHMSSLRTEFRGLERQVTRDLKAAAKINLKRKRKSGNRAPSGFVKPTLISNELAAFLGKP